MTSIQKIYLLDYMRKQKGQKPYYTENSFSSQFVPNKKIPQDEVTIEEVKTIIKNKDIDIVNMYNIDSIDDLIRFELLNVITNNVVIKKCKYCNRYFVPKGRSDSEYCDRISKGETRPCNEIGAVKLHEASKADDKVYQAYLKAYRRMNSHARQKKISQNKFY